MKYRKNAYTVDTETIGLTGPAVLIQWAYEDGPIHLHHVWDTPVKDTLALIEDFCSGIFVGFNVAFDWFQLCKIYTMFRLLPPDACPSDIPMDVLVKAEKEGRDGPCLKPKGVVDLMLHSRKGKFQTLMSRHDIKVTKVPTPLAYALCRKLEESIELEGILFAKRANPDAPKWGVFDRIKKGKEDQVDPNFKDVILRFKPDGGLKSLAEHCLGLNPEFNSFGDVHPERPGKVFELRYAPFALAVSSAEVDWKVWSKDNKLKGQAWPALIQYDVDHWRFNEEARRYAEDDVKYTRLLDGYFGFPEDDDDDFILSCMVAAVRWHGFKIDVPQIEKLLKTSKAVLDDSPVNINKPAQVKRHIREVMDDSEATLIDKSTKKANLEKIRADYVVLSEDIDPETGGEVCVRCFGEGEEGEERERCPRCEGKGYLLEGPTLASERADEILKCKAAAKEVELYSKLLKAGRFHAAFKVIGTLSSRMAGGEGLNAQGIKSSEEVRGAFPLKWGGKVLVGGDFDGFEVTLADAVFQDEKLRADLLAGKSIHTAMACQIYPDKTEEQIKASKNFGDGGDIDMYTRGKQAVFATLYGGDANTINKKLSIPKKIADQAFDSFQQEYPGMRRARDEVSKKFQALKQHGEVGKGRITYTPPSDYIETFLGFRRYFPLENKIAKHLFDMASNLPREWRGLDWKVVRRDREQTPGGAISSALYGSAFQIQASIIRAANNHLIQSPGAVITKKLQRRIWDTQPSGVGEWIVAPLNVHDEVLSVTHPDYVETITKTAIEVVESYRDRVPLIGMDWIRSIENWAGKKGSSEDLEVHIGPHGITGADNVYVPPMDVEELEELEEADDPCIEVVVDSWI